MQQFLKIVIKKMVVGKILIDLRQFWPRGRCLLKRHLPQFSKSWYIFKKIEFKLKVSLQETPSTIPKNWIYIKCVSWKDIFPRDKNSNMKRHLPQFDKFECLMILKLKMSLEKTLSTIPKNFNLYKRCHLKRHFPQFHKFQYILKVSLQ